MKLFTVGPVQMHPGTLKISGKQLPYFRTDDFSKITLDSERLLKKFAKADDKCRVVFLTSSGTGAMEATVINCLDSRDKVLIINGGSFGSRFCQICKIHKIPYDSIDLSFGEKLTESTLKQYDGLGYTALLVNIDETSTGQFYDPVMLSDFCKKNNMLFIVDAISSFLADDLRFTKMEMDAMIISSQKALSLSPGLSMVILSKRMIDERISRIDSGSLYFDFKDHLKNGERGQTPFTPAVGILLELNGMLHEIDKIGIDESIKMTKHRADYFRSIIKDLPINIPNYPLSNAVTPIIIENGNAYDIHLKLMNDHDIVVTPNGGELKNKVLRISHLGNLNEEDYRDLVEKMKPLLK